MATKKTGGEEIAAEKTEHTFSKAQLASSQRFRDRRDIVSALLDEDKKYTAEAVEEMIDKYMKGTVK